MIYSFTNKDNFILHGIDSTTEHDCSFVFVFCIILLQDLYT